MVVRPLLIGQHALITGGSKGLGFEISKRLSAEGCKITQLARSKDQLRSSTEFLNENYKLEKSYHDYIVCDLTDTEHLSKNIISRYPDYQGINILINCAGKSQHKLLIGTTDQEIEGIYKVNVIAPTILCRLLARNMIRHRLKNANIVNVSSMLAKRYLPGTVVYTASKLAINKLTINLSREMQRKGGQIVRVNCVSPCLVRETDMGNTANFSKINEMGLGDMVCTRSEVADEVVRLVTNPHLTGCIVDVHNDLHK